MMSMEAILEMSSRATREAARRKKHPYVPWDDAEVDDWRSFPFPFIGDYVPPDWTMVEEKFCDSSGFGQDDEPALSVRQLKAWVKEFSAKPGTFGFAVTERGQFQCRVAVYEYAGAKLIRRRRLKSI